MKEGDRFSSWKEGLAAFALCLAVSLVLYAPVLGSGFASDDFLYRSWARDGLSPLIKRVTVDSYPRMLRPLPAVVWYAVRTIDAAWLAHLVSVALHAAVATALFACLRALGRSRGVAGCLALLFTASPLASEAVAWPSASFDLWAGLFGLLAVLVAIHPGERRPWAPMTWAAFSLGLASKESLLALPALLPFLGVSWRKAAITALPLALYLPLRFLLFGPGLGGYAGATATSLSIQGAARFLRNVILQVPARLLAPCRGLSRGEALGLAAVSGLLLLAVVLASRIGGKSWARALARAAAVFLIALLPAAAIFRIDWNQEGARLIYFPLAAALLALGAALPSLKRRAAIPTAGLLLLWSAASFANSLVWREAFQRVESTLAAMRSFQDRVPAGSLVLVDALDSYHGAYVFRNGLPEAARLAGLRTGVQWRRGTSAALEGSRIGEIGRTVFVLEPRPGGGFRDWSRCERTLRESRETSPSRGEGGDRADGADRAVATLVMPAFDPPASLAGVELAFDGACLSSGPLTGTVFWRSREGVPFTIESSREFLVAAAARSTFVRVGREDGAGVIQLRLDFDAPISRRCATPAVVPSSAAACQPDANESIFGGEE